MNTMVQLIVKIGDLLLGWLFCLPRDLRLLALALITTILMSVIKYLVVDVDWMARARSDLKTLTRLIKNARAEKDTSALERYNYTRALIRMRQLKAEFKALVVVLIPLLFIGTWSWYRMEYNPPAVDETIEVAVYTPASAIGQMIYLVPTDDVQPDQRIKVIDQSTDGPYPGIVSWTLRMPSSDQPRLLVFRTGDRTIEQSVITVGKHYMAPPLTDPDSDWHSELVMEETKLFGIVPGIKSIEIPAWITAYVLLVFLLLPLNRRILKVS